MRAAIGGARHREGLAHHLRADLVHVGCGFLDRHHIEPGLEPLGERQVEEHVDPVLALRCGQFGDGLANLLLIRRIVVPLLQLMWQCKHLYVFLLR